MRDSHSSRFATNGYVVRKYALIVFAVAYVVVAEWGSHVSPMREFFPVFNWSLFTWVNPHPMQTELHVVRVGDQVFPKPVNYFELDAYFDNARRRSSAVQKVVRRLRLAILANDQPEITRLRKIIEFRHLDGRRPVEYEIRTIEFDPLERWKNKHYVGKEAVLAHFKVEDVR